MSTRRLSVAVAGLIGSWMALSGARGAEPAGPTFSREVAPILQKRCQACHRPGEAAPMSLLSYEETRPWAESIKDEVAARRMPPWHADPQHGKFANDPTLTQAELDTLVRWADAGAPEGSRGDLPPPLRFTDGWNIGKPDAVFTMPREFKVPAQGTVPYKYFEVPTGFTEDRWVAKAEVRPGNRTVVHHILVFVLPPGARARNIGSNWNIFLAGTAPGEEPTEFPEGMSKKVPAGSTLIFQVHYTTSGKEAVDRSSIGLVFAKEPSKGEVVTRAIANPLLFLPPGTDNVPVGAEYTFSREGRILSFMPHMHLRGKSFEYRAVFPDGTEKVLLSVPRWDFNWQHSYRPAEPLLMPKGTKILCRALFDNSSSNKHNPDPKQGVRWGDQTWEEMMIGFMDIVREPQARDAKARKDAKADEEKGRRGRV